MAFEHDEGEATEEVHESLLVLDQIEHVEHEDHVKIRRLESLLPFVRRVQVHLFEGRIDRECIGHLLGGREDQWVGIDAQR
jgi:hypothetical protein